MKYLSVVAFLIAAVTVQGQNYALRDINNNLLYDPSQPIVFLSRMSRTAEGFNTFYNLTAKDTAIGYTIQWEVRKTFGEEEGTPVSADRITETRTPGSIRGKVFVPGSASPQVLIAKVVDPNIKKAWWYYRILEPNYPANGILTSKEGEVIQPFIYISQEVRYEGPGSSLIVSYYDDDFPAAAPAFSEALTRVSKKMMHDSVFSVTPGEPISFSKPGLYLFQKDTLSAEAVAVRVQDDYPRFQKVQSLADPLIYVCTKQEFDKVKAAKGDKKAFDRVILSITGDTERARNFMRSYFRRVELANQYFTSYKEGWKTDRGMIYMVFGLPEEVSKLSDREIWSYNNSYFKTSFTFAKSGTIFDPDNFVLIREKKYQDTWYQVIDLWRNARF